MGSLGASNNGVRPPHEPELACRGLGFREVCKGEENDLHVLVVMTWKGSDPKGEQYKPKKIAEAHPEAGKQSQPKKIALTYPEVRMIPRWLSCCASRKN
ncbi:hypothetical protein PC112_g8496 [Phytophthora cactorum]|nr:hypothetical protein PC112_g8496 [Phytophthora cactorum]